MIGITTRTKMTINIAVRMLTDSLWFAGFSLVVERYVESELSLNTKRRAEAEHRGGAQCSAREGRTPVAA
jgi:hypothetical protein